jgi:crotonobetainyl-CoA:carnitine CoA-transferase CaiB-like acyl-CoA transferase
MDLTGIEWPTQGMVGHGDGMSGMTLAGGICAALLHRERTGEAKLVDGSLIGTAVWFNGTELLRAQAAPAERALGPAKRPPPPPGAGPFLSAVRTVYQTKDYRFIYLLFLTDDDRDFADLCQRLGREDLVADERFTRSRDRVAHTSVLQQILEAEFAARTYEECKDLLAKARGAWAPVQSPEEIFEDPQTIANGFVGHVDYPGGGLKVPAPPILFDEEAGDPPRAPDFAEHTDAILTELGYGAEEIAKYRQSGAVA